MAGSRADDTTGRNDVSTPRLARAARLRSSRGLLAVLIVAAATRIAAIHTLRTFDDAAGAYEHASIAESLANDRGFRFAFFSAQPEPTSHQAPAVPFLLSLCYRACGVHSPAACLLFQYLNVLFAIPAGVAVFVISRRLWNARIALWSAGCFALYPPLIYAVTRIQSVNWSVCWLLIMLTGLIGMARRPAWSTAFLTGAGAGLGLLGEPILGAAFVCSAAGAVALIRRRRGAWLPAAGCLALGVMLTVAPWTIRNDHVHGGLVPIKSSFWYVFWQGNNLWATGVDKLEVTPDLRRQLVWRWGFAGLEAQLEAARRQARSVDSLLTARDLAELRSRSTELAKMDYFRARVLRELRREPGRYVQLCLKRLMLLAWFDNTNPRSFALPYRLSYLVLAALALCGTCLAMRGRTRLDWRIVALAAAGLCLVFTTVITSARFRLLLEALLLLPAGCSVAALCGMLRRRTERAGAPTLGVRWPAESPWARDNSV